jgi:hypothetical protein
MPTIAASELSPPKSWDEFEDIVWNLYLSLWKDPYAQRHGRSGQAQHGVDIHGQPQWLGGGYAGIQCKRYKRGTLTEQDIELEVTKAEGFEPELSEYTIATTDRRDAGLQKFVRRLNKQRCAQGRFEVHLAFWEDICSLLTDPSNRGLLRKYYPEQFPSIVSAPTVDELFQACQVISAHVAAELLGTQRNVSSIFGQL